MSRCPDCRLICQNYLQAIKDRVTQILHPVHLTGLTYLVTHGAVNCVVSAAEVERHDDHSINTNFKNTANKSVSLPYMIKVVLKLLTVM